MLPKELGGVVDASLKVYGLANVRVADSSIYPIEFAAHVRSSLPFYLSFSVLFRSTSADLNVHPF